MRIGILPIVLAIGLGVLGLVGWALVRLVTNRDHRRAVSGLAILVMACCTTLWFGLCSFFMLWASLGHSAHPLRDSWPECAVSFLILIVLPLAIIIWLSKRKAN